MAFPEVLTACVYLDGSYLSKLRTRAWSTLDRSFHRSLDPVTHFRDSGRGGALRLGDV